MERALPVAVKFLQKGNKELSKNLASYLSLAAIEYAYLLGPHISHILDSIAIGNYGLCQILPQIYEISAPVLDKKVFILVPLLRTCEVHDKLALLQLFSMILRKSPAALEGSISQICDTLSTDSAPVLTSTMNLLLRVAEEYPAKLHNHFPKIREAAEKHPSCAAAASQVLTTAGKSNRVSSLRINFSLAILISTDLPFPFSLAPNSLWTLFWNIFRALIEPRRRFYYGTPRSCAPLIRCSSTRRSWRVSARRTTSRHRQPQRRRRV